MLSLSDLTRRGCAAIACASLVAFAVPAHPADSPKPPKPPRATGWVEARTANFAIYSNASNARTRKVAVSLERFRDALGRITRGMKLDTRVPTRIYVFKNDPTFQPFKLDDRGHPRNAAGYFLPGPFLNAIALDASAGDRPMRVVYHEYFHAVMDASIGNLPLWLNEGLAEYYSTFQVRDGSTRVEVGHPIPEHVQSLGSGNWLPWDDVFDTTPDSPSYNEASRQGAFYAQSWLLVHYLASDSERAKQLGRYLTALRAGAEEATAFAEAFGAGRGELTQGLREYLDTGGSFYTWDLGEEATAVELTTRELEPAEASFYLGDLLARRWQLPAAEHYLGPAGEGGWPPAPIEIARGYAAYFNDDEAEAEAHFRRAIAGKSASAEPYVLLADLVIQRYRREGSSAVPQPETAPPVLEARALLEAAPQPDDGEFLVLTGLANTYLLGADDVGPGVAAIERAMALRPLASNAVRLRACLLARQGRPAEAWAVVARDLARVDPDTARETNYCIADAVVRVAWERAEAGNEDGADAVLQDAEAATPDPAVAARFSAMRRALAGGASVVFAEPQRDDSVERYNQAARLASAGRHEDAIVVLESLVADCDDSSACETARRSLDELQRVARHNGWVQTFNSAIGLANDGDRKGAIAVLRELEAEVTDAKLLDSVVSVLQSLGARPSKSNSN